MRKLLLTVAMFSAVLSLSKLALAEQVCQEDRQECTQGTKQVCEIVPEEVCNDVTRTVCEDVDVQECHVVHHSGELKWVTEGRHHYLKWFPAWDENVCTTHTEEQCHNVTSTECTTNDKEVCSEQTSEDCVTVPGECTEVTPVATKSFRPKFTEDKRCHATKPEMVTWAKVENGELSWSATGGSKVEMYFGWTKDIMPFHVILTNDGHEKIGLGTDIGFFGKFFKMRTINDCTKGDWKKF